MFYHDKPIEIKYISIRMTKKYIIYLIDGQTCC